MITRLIYIISLLINLRIIATTEYIDDDYIPFIPKEFNSTRDSVAEAKILNQEHANLFKEWLDYKSDQLYEMSRNYSAFKLLNETFNTKLREEVNFAVINFTSMIVNISQHLSEVLNKKSQIVENLSNFVEKSYENYKNDNEKVKKSIDAVYYDSKSPKTFCDVVENHKKIDKEQTNTTEPKSLRLRRSSKENCFNTNYCTNRTKKMIRSLNRQLNKPKALIPTTTQTTTTSTTTLPNNTEEIEDDYQNEDYEDDSEDEEDDESIDELYWDIDCINRTHDENFKSVQKVNRNQSTIQVPTNIFKLDLSINMTAYWTEELDTQFKTNYDNDNELYWQYFCSSNGMYRQYPGAYWTVPKKEDFFDCRLQSWYMMAAASAKDILFLLDISGSMTGLRLEIGKKLIEFLLDTFSDNDFFNIILYSDTVSFHFRP